MGTNVVRDRQLWWLAVNGPSVAAAPAPIAASELQVSPTPRQLIGFTRQAQQLEPQRFPLAVPTAQVEERIAAYYGHRRDLTILRPARPEPPTQGAVAWGPRRGYEAPAA